MDPRSRFSFAIDFAAPENTAGLPPSAGDAPAFTFRFTVVISESGTGYESGFRTRFKHCSHEP